MTNNNQTKNKLTWLTIDRLQPTTDWRQTLHESFSQYHQGWIDLSHWTNQIYNMKTDKHYALNFKDNFWSDYWNISHQQQLFPELP